MRVAGGGFEQCYNAQVAVDTDTLLVVAQGLTQVQAMLGDRGYSSERNIAACEVAEIEPYLAVAREDHHPGWRERFAEPGIPSPNTPPLVNP